MRHRYHQRAYERRRAAWAYVTRHPDAGVREVARHLGCHAAVAHGHLAWLEAAGYIAREVVRAWEIVIPCFSVIAPAHPGVNATEAR
jgi:predicted ArsR family transcriptional regulator